MFDKDKYLDESLIYFIDKFEGYEKEADKNGGTQPDYIDVLGEVIEHFYDASLKEYSSEEIVESIGYNAEELEEDYDFNEEHFYDSFVVDDKVTNYMEALAYFSLNHAFVKNHEEYLCKRFDIW